MLLKIDVFDKSRRFHGILDLELDWKLRNWAVVADLFRVWDRLSRSRGGSFVASAAGELRLLDTFRRCPLLLLDAPRGEGDSPAFGGELRVPEPADPNLAGGEGRWTVSESAAAAAPVETSALSARRGQLLTRLRELLPCTYGSKNYDTLTGGAKRGATKTNCYMLPGFVSYELGAKKLPPAQQASYLKQWSLNGMSRIRTQGLKRNAWITADRVKRPRPGDVYGLLYWDKTDLDGDFSHVGVIESAEGTEWRTADFGQGSGWDGVRDYARTYDPAAGTLTGNGNRVLGGWVDIDLYFG
jgi:hypothetical protein